MASDGPPPPGPNHPPPHQPMPGQNIPPVSGYNPMMYRSMAPRPDGQRPPFNPMMRPPMNFNPNDPRAGYPQHMFNPRMNFNPNFNPNNMPPRGPPTGPIRPTVDVNPPSSIRPPLPTNQALSPSQTPPPSQPPAPTQPPAQKPPPPISINQMSVRPEEPIEPIPPSEEEFTEDQLKSMRKAVSDMVNQGLITDPRYTTLIQHLQHAEHCAKVWENYRTHLTTYENLKKAYDQKHNPQNLNLPQSIEHSADSLGSKTGVPKDVSLNDISTESFAKDSEENLPTSETTTPAKSGAGTGGKSSSSSASFNSKQQEQLRAQLLVYKDIISHTPVNPDVFNIAVGNDNIKKIDLTHVDTKLAMPNNSYQVKTHAMPPENLDPNSMKTATGIKPFPGKEEQPAVPKLTSVAPPAVDPPVQPPVLPAELPADPMPQASAGPPPMMDPSLPGSSMPGPSNPGPSNPLAGPVDATHVLPLPEDQTEPILDTSELGNSENLLVDPNPILPPEKKSFDNEYLKKALVEYSCRTKLTPVTKPQGPDIQTLLKERDHRIQARIEQRILILSNLPVLDNPEHQRKAQLELRSLRLLGLQRKIRQQVVQANEQETSLDTILNMKHYRRTKKISLREARVTEKLEKQRDLVLEQRKRQRFLDYIEAVQEHALKFTQYHKNNQQKLQKQSAAIIHYHKNYEREKKREEERMERERLRLLQQDDEDGYRKLIDSKKNKRLAYLLDQTDDYLNQMMSLVREHQGQLQAKKVKFNYGMHAINIDPKAPVPVKHHKLQQVKMNADDGAPARENLEEWLMINAGWKEMTPIEISNYKRKQEEIRLELEKKKEAEKYAGKTEEEIAALKIKEGMEKEDNDTYEKTEGDSSEQKDYYSVAHGINEEVKEQPKYLEWGKLKPYQMKGLEWMVSLYNNNLNGILADEMGLGKTIQTIALVTYLIEKKALYGPYLIIVPLTTMSNWELEFKRWAPKIVFVAYKGHPNERKRLAQVIKCGNFNVCLTTYEYIIRDKHVLSKLRWKYTIVDEGHRMRNQNSKLTSTLNTQYVSPHRILLTGTPLQNKLPELWALLNFLLPSIFKSAESFDQWFNAPFANTGEKVELSEEEKILIIRRLHKIMRPFLLRRLKKDVEKQLPPKTEYVIKCPMSALQRRVYTHMSSESMILGDQEGKDNKPKGKTLMNTLMQLRKICNHPFQFPHFEEQIGKHFGYPNGQVYGPDLHRAAGKFDVLDRILPKLKAAGHRVLMFCQMTTTMTVLEDYFNYRGYKYLRLDGMTKSEERGDLLAKFNNPTSEHFLFVLSTKAGGLGLNLQTADTVIIYDSDWNPAQDAQAMARAHRIGQKFEVKVLRLVTAKSVEEKIYAAAQHKMNIDNKVIQAGKFDNKSTGFERRQMLEEILQLEAEDDEDEGVHDNESINHMMKRSEEEFEYFQRMDLLLDLRDKFEYSHLDKARALGYFPEDLPEPFEEYEEKITVTNEDGTETVKTRLLKPKPDLDYFEKREDGSIRFKFPDFNRMKTPQIPLSKLPPLPEIKEDLSKDKDETLDETSTLDLDETSNSKDGFSQNESQDDEKVPEKIKEHRRKKELTKSKKKYHSGDDLKIENKRLISDKELPTWLRLSEEELKEKIEKQKIEEESAQGPRKRQTKIIASDVLTEQEWLEAVDEGLDPDEVAREKLEKQKAAENDSMNVTLDAEGSTRINQSTMESEFSDEEGGKSSGRRGKKRKKGRGSTKKTEDNSDEAPSRKKGRRSRVDKDNSKEAVDPEEQNKMKELLDFISKVKDPLDKKRTLAKPFKQLPSKSELPDYYDLIQNPVDINRMKKKTKSGGYKSVMELAEDFELLISNAKTYNMDGSQIFEDAKVLNDYFNKALNNIMESGEIGEVELSDVPEEPEPDHEEETAEDEEPAEDE